MCEDHDTAVIPDEQIDVDSPGMSFVAYFLRNDL
jgi:hypothetical protein